MVEGVNWLLCRLSSDPQMHTVVYACSLPSVKTTTFKRYLPRGVFMSVIPSHLYPQWKHYTECDGSPDPRIAQEMNTFISLWEEEKNETFEQVMEKSKLVLSVSTAA